MFQVPSIGLRDVESEEAYRQALVTIAEAISELAGKYPELSSWDGKAVKEQIEACAFFRYEHNYEDLTGKSGLRTPQFGKNGCLIGVWPHRLGVEQYEADYPFPGLRLLLHAPCVVSPGGSRDLETEGRRIIEAAVAPLRELSNRRGRSLSRATSLLKFGMSGEQALRLLGPPNEGHEPGWRYASFPPGEHDYFLQIDLFFVDGQLDKVVAARVK